MHWITLRIDTEGKQFHAKGSTRRRHPGPRPARSTAIGCVAVDLGPPADIAASCNDLPIIEIGQPGRGIYQMRHRHARDIAATPDLSVGDPVLGKTRLLSRQCDTCILRPGNPMHLPPGRLQEMIGQARDDGGYIICHDTLPYGQYPHVKPAICRGFHDRYSTQALQVIGGLWGFTEVDPPSETPPAV